MNKIVFKISKKNSVDSQFHCFLSRGYIKKRIWRKKYRLKHKFITRLKLYAFIRKIMLQCLHLLTNSTLRAQFSFLKKLYYYV